MPGRLWLPTTFLLCSALTSARFCTCLLTPRSVHGRTYTFLWRYSCRRRCSCSRSRANCHLVSTSPQAATPIRSHPLACGMDSYLSVGAASPPVCTRVPPDARVKHSFLLRWRDDARRFPFSAAACEPPLFTIPRCGNRCRRRCTRSRARANRPRPRRAGTGTRSSRCCHAATRAPAFCQ